jgi:DMSO/TMAO reductase YedYZ molybdopterin-dependent catalytic subunit
VQLGFKIVKWLRAIEFVKDDSDIRGGHGGWARNHPYSYQSLAI